MGFFRNCFSLIWAHNLGAQAGILASETRGIPLLFCLKKAFKDDARRL